MIKIYTDGSCLNNPGNGGWAAIISINDEVRRISGSVKDTTNNKMELMAPIKALQEIKEHLLVRPVAPAVGKQALEDLPIAAFEV